MRKHGLLSLVSVLLGVLSLSACDVSAPSKISLGKIRIQEQMVALPLEGAQVPKVAEQFTRTGKGDMTITISYMAREGGSRMRAEAQGDTYRKMFSQYGVSNIAVVTVPVSSRKDAEKSVVTYMASVALPPEGCHGMPGHLGAGNIAAADGYNFGCDTQTAVSKMIADPSDLMGKPGTQNGDSQRNGTIIEPYKAGTPNEQMKGFQASGIGG